MFHDQAAPLGLAFLMAFFDRLLHAIRERMVPPPLLKSLLARVLRGAESDSKQPGSTEPSTTWPGARPGATEFGITESGGAVVKTAMSHPVDVDATSAVGVTAIAGSGDTVPLDAPDEACAAEHHASDLRGDVARLARWLARRIRVP